MVKLNCNYGELRFEHIVDFTTDRTCFIAARYNGNRVRLFLLTENGNIYTRNGSVQWEQVTEYDAELIRTLVSESRARQDIPIYRVNGNHSN